MPRPSMTGFLWTNGVTVLVDTAYNSGVNRVLDYIDAHAHNTTVGGQAPDQHTASHILSPALSIAAASTGTLTDVGTRLSEIATRVNAIEGSGAANWQTGGVPMNLAAVYTAINGHTIVGAPPTAIDWAAVTNTNTLDINAINQNFKVIPGGSPLRTVVKAALGYNAATGVAAFKVDATVTHTSSTVGMTAGQFRYDGISLDAFGNPVLTTGTGSASPLPPGTPPGQKVLAYVLIPYNTDATLIPAVNIRDVRGNSVAEGGGGGSGGTSLNHPYGSFGTGTDISTPSVDTPTVLEGGYLGTSTTINGVNLGNVYVHTDMTKDVATDASLGDMLDSYGATNIMALVRAGVAAGTVTIAADANNPVPMAIQGRRRKIVAPIAATAAGGAGIRYLIASCATAGVNSWTISLSASPAVAAFQTVLALFWWDGGTLQVGTAIDFTQIFSTSSTSVLQEGANAVGTIPAAGYPTLTGNSAFQSISGIPASVFYLPKPATVDVRLNAAWVVPTASSSNQFRVVIDAVPEGMPIFAQPGASGGNASSSVNYRRTGKLGAGIHSVTMQAFVTTGQSLGVISDGCAAFLDFSN